MPKRKKRGSLSVGPPTGKLSTRERPFEVIVEELRHTVYAIIRGRPNPDGSFEGGPLGSGFFVSPGVFMTCHHVMNNPNAPHQDGDNYILVSTRSNMTAVGFEFNDVKVGKELFLYPEKDLALLTGQIEGKQPFVAMDWGDPRVGRDIGVVGYPLGQLSIEDGVLQFNRFLYRAARGNVTARYKSDLESSGAQKTDPLEIIEVNFLFVPGNSGGPLFNAETGVVYGYVHGFWDFKVKEHVEQAHPTTTLPKGVIPHYIRDVSGIYSLGIKLDHARDPLLQLGVTI